MRSAYQGIVDSIILRFYSFCSLHLLVRHLFSPAQTISETRGLQGQEPVELQHEDRASGFDCA